jgi:hypothetical protein
MKYTFETVDEANIVRSFVCEYKDEIDYTPFYKAFESCDPIRLKTVQGSVVFINSREISHLSITPYVETAPEITSSS